MPDQITRLLEEIDRLDQEATKGPWIIDSIESGEHALFVDEDNPEYGHLGAASSTVASFLLAKNADFIAHARESLPALSRAVRAVLELHAKRDDLLSRGGKPICDGCGDAEGWAYAYPCPTVQAITDAMESDE